MNKSRIHLFSSIASCSALLLLSGPVACVAQPEPAVPTAPAAPAPPAEPRGAGGGGGGGSSRAQEEAAKQLHTAFAYEDHLFKLKSSGDSRNDSLILPKDGVPKNAAEIEEDLDVMSHILEKAAVARDDRSKQAMGILVRSPFSGGSTRNMYIEGYGAIFFVSVNFPFLPPPAKSTDAEAKPEEPSEWEVARRELRRPAEPNFDFNWSGPGQSGGEEYDTAKVETLKKNLTAALKNASNLRALKSDETVTIVVNGRNPSEPKAKTVRSNNSRSVASIPRSGSERGLDRKNPRLIIRAKRSDIESFQKDKLSPEEFRKKTTVSVF